MDKLENINKSNVNHNADMVQYLPGDRKPNNRIDSILRVNHAGEVGACVIYKGQMTAAKLRGYPVEVIEEITEMHKQELTHREYFAKEISKCGVRPSLLDPLWKCGGWLMGFVTALHSQEMMMICTVEVEKVIDSHYQSQIIYLTRLMKNFSDQGGYKVETFDCIYDIGCIGSYDNHFLENLTWNIEKFRLEELEHKDIAADHLSGIKNSSFNINSIMSFGINSIMIRNICKIAISIAKKI